MSPSRRFEDRVSIITGAASGIGLATAEAFAAEGAAVLLLDIDDERGERAAQTIAATDTQAVFLHTDVSSSDDCTRAAALALERFGRIDCLVNCAVNFNFRGLDATPADWETCLHVNIEGCATMVQVCASGLAASGNGSVVNVSSTSGYIAQPGRWTYNSTKGAILSLTRCQALDLAPMGIRVNSVSPGTIWTPEVDRLAGGDRARWEPSWGKYHMLRRCGDPEEVGRPILFLCSEDASFITGTDLKIDGGYLGMGHEGVTGEDVAQSARAEG
jgi:NAD(P)-dependent dehydrogenase (short-subunit alcohol dehydrogenase family)